MMVRSTFRSLLLIAPATLLAMTSCQRSQPRRALESPAEPSPTLQMDGVGTQGGGSTLVVAFKRGVREALDRFRATETPATSHAGNEELNAFYRARRAQWTARLEELLADRFDITLSQAALGRPGFRITRKAGRAELSLGVPDLTEPRGFSDEDAFALAIRVSAALLLESERELELVDTVVSLLHSSRAAIGRAKATLHFQLPGKVGDVALSRDGRWLVAWDENGAAFRLNLATDLPPEKLAGKAIAHLGGNKLLVQTGDTCRILDIRNDTGPRFPCPAGIREARLLSDGALAVQGEGQLRLIEPSSGHFRDLPIAFTLRETNLSLDGKYYEESSSSWEDRQRLRIKRVADGATVHSMEDKGFYFVGVHFTPQATFLAAESSNFQVGFDSKNEYRGRRKTRIVHLPSGATTELADWNYADQSGEGTAFLLTKDKTVMALEPATGKRRQITLADPYAYLWETRFFPGETADAFAHGGDGLISLLDLRQGVETILDHRHPTASLPGVGFVARGFVTGIGRAVVSHWDTQISVSFLDLGVSLSRAHRSPTVLRDANGGIRPALDTTTAMPLKKIGPLALPDSERYPETRHPFENLRRSSESWLVTSLRLGAASARKEMEAHPELPSPNDGAKEYYRAHRSAWIQALRRIATETSLIVESPAFLEEQGQRVGALSLPEEEPTQVVLSRPYLTRPDGLTSSRAFGLAVHEAGHLAIRRVSPTDHYLLDQVSSALLERGEKTLPANFHFSVKEGVKRAELSSDGRLLTVVGGLDQVYVWERESEQVRALPAPTAFLEGDWLGSLSNSGDAVTALNLRTNEEKRFSQPGSFNRFSPSIVAGSLLTLADDGEIFAHSLATGRSERFRMGPRTALGACFSPDGQLAMDFYQDKAILRSRASGEPLEILRAWGQAERASFHPENTEAVAGFNHYSGSAAVWVSLDTHETHSFPGWEPMSFSPDGKWVLLKRYDGILLFNPDRREKVQLSIQNHLLEAGFLPGRSDLAYLRDYYGISIVEWASGKQRARLPHAVYGSAEGIKLAPVRIYRIGTGYAVLTHLSNGEIYLSLLPSELDSHE